MTTTTRPIPASFLLLLLAIFIFAGCNNAKRTEAPEPAPQLSIVDSLLGTEYFVTTCQKSFRPPILFQPASDSILELIRYNMNLDAETENTLALENCFLDEAHHAGLLITVVKGLTLQSDTTAFLQEYRQSFYDLFGWANVNEKDLWIGDVFVKSFTIADSQNVHLKLLCLSQVGNALELNYFCPRELYPLLTKRIESSAASIKMMTPAF